MIANYGLLQRDRRTSSTALKLSCHNRCAKSTQQQKNRLKFARPRPEGLDIFICDYGNGPFRNQSQ